MILKIIDNKYRAVIPKNERIALKLKPGDMFQVEFIKKIDPCAPE